MLSRQLLVGNEGEELTEVVPGARVVHDGGRASSARHTKVIVDFEVAQFAIVASEVLTTVLNMTENLILVLDIAVELEARKRGSGVAGVVLLPTANYWGGGGGGVSRRPPGTRGEDSSARGVFGNLGMTNVSKYSLLGTDQAASVSGKCSTSARKESCSHVLL